MLYFLFSFENGFNLNHLGLLGQLFASDTYAEINGAVAMGKVIPLPIVLALLLLSAFIGYLMGSINTAVIVSGKMYNEDVRSYGSGNAGFSNMMRNYGKKASLITLAGDFLKTVVAVMIGWVLYGYAGAVTGGFFTFIGHIFPMFFKFRGGKGVVCLASVIFMLDWRLFLIAVAIFVVAVLVTKYISFGSVLSGMTLPLFMSRVYGGTLTPQGLRLKSYATILAFIAVVILVFKHKENLKRIFNGTESKFEFKKSKKESAASQAEK